jgi:hypothetical protein
MFALHCVQTDDNRPNTRVAVMPVVCFTTNNHPPTPLCSFVRLVHRFSLSITLVTVLSFSTVNAIMTVSLTKFLNCLIRYTDCSMDY